MTILDTIIATKHKEVAERSISNPLAKLAASNHFKRECLSFKESLNLINGPSIIAEFKRKSPSKDFHKSHLMSSDVCPNYELSGARALSILTDNHYFGGSSSDLSGVRNHISVPILRKDFIIDPYQVYEAKSIGADCILLIASCLTKNEIIEYTALAHDLNLEVLLEIHSQNELDKIYPKVDAIGVNNRDLSSFTTDYKHSLQLLPELPQDILKVSESGIDSREQINELFIAGYKSFLIGGHFMQTEDPSNTFHDFISTLNHAHVN